MPEDIVLFVQQRCGKSGAPTALVRLMGHDGLRSLRPVLLTSTQGWLTEECQRRNVPFVSVPFSNARSPWARLFGNYLFARRVRRALAQRDFRPRVVIGNDHLEGLRALAISRDWNARRMIFLRSSETTRRDFFKYGCHQFNRIFAFGDDLYRRVEEWNSGNHVKLLYDGLDNSEFLPPKPKAARFPCRILVVGSESHYKGWQDFATAVDLLEQNPDFPAVEFDFTGHPPDSPINDMRLGKPRRCRFNFIGRSEKFQELVRGYDLVVHPSREEAFGLAMIEILAAGVPLFCSRTGMIDQVQDNSVMLFSPNSAADLAEKFDFLWRRWDTIDPAVVECQANIRRKFLMDVPAGQISKEIHSLIQGF